MVGPSKITVVFFKTADNEADETPQVQVVVPRAVCLSMSLSQIPIPCHNVANFGMHIGEKSNKCNQLNFSSKQDLPSDRHTPRRSIIKLGCLHQFNLSPPKETLVDAFVSAENTINIGLAFAMKRMHTGNTTM